MRWRYVLIVETLFLLAFVAWAWVRAHDPAANHTEKPMDLMFMNSIRSSPTYPPQDAWLAGYPISYYYFGYWLLTVTGMLAGQQPEIAYNVGQACWYGLLLTGCFGIGYNLLAAERGSLAKAALAGFLSALMVGMAGNLHGILDWLHANGVDVSGLAAWLRTPNFPQGIPVTFQWHVGFDWWWWRSSRVIEDLDLAGQHIEVIGEFPAFSYILGDNHPHVMAMPFVLLIIALALNIVLGKVQSPESRVQSPEPPPTIRDSGLRTSDFGLWTSVFGLLRSLTPLGWGGWLIVAVATGSLIALNSWDYPPYWLLVVAAIFVAGWQRERAATGAADWGRIVALAALGGVLLAFSSLAIYLPYLLTAQSQASGLAANLFNPTQLGQYVTMWGPILLANVALILIAWAAVRPRWTHLAASLGIVYGIPAVFLVVSAWAVNSTERGREMVERMALPAGASSHLPYIIERWVSQPFTFLLAGGLLAIFLTLIWSILRARRASGAEAERPVMLFVLILAALGMALTYAPEFVFLRDNFGTRMNTVFKFYYQAWLLLSLAGAYAIVKALTHVGDRVRMTAAVLSGAALALILASLIYLAAGVYSKTNGFAAEPTFDATAYLAAIGPDEKLAVQWLRDHTLPDDLVLEGKGASYIADTSRSSTMTGRPTLLGWDGHEAQWRGKAFADMALGRPEALTLIYQNGTAEQMQQLVDLWGIDYVYVGPSERSQYGMTPASERRLAEVMDPVFDSGSVRIYRTR